MLLKGGLNIQDLNLMLGQGSGTSLRVNTVYGWVDVGAQNASYAHIYTDRPRFYMNVGLNVDGALTQLGNQVWHAGNFNPGNYAALADPVFTGGGINFVPGEGRGLNFWQSTSYSIAMGSTAAEYQYGPVTDYSMKFSMDQTAGRGFTWGSRGAKPIAALSNVGHMTIAGTFNATDGYAQTSLGGGRVYTGYDSGLAGSVSCSNWFRTNGATGLYFASYGSGVCPPTGEFGSVQAYGSMSAQSSWAGFAINGGAVFMHNNSTSGSWGIYNDYNNTWMLLSDMAGNATFTGNVTAYSDRRIKKEITPIKDALARLLQITGVTFKRIEDDAPGIGVVAQDVQAVFPEAVTTAYRDAEQTQDVLTVAYGNLVGPIIEAIRELSARIEKLEAA